MKKSIAILMAFWIVQGKAQNILSMPTIVQEQDQWCWAGSTKCIMDYYGNNYNQCQIAEYTRTVATWHSYGGADCCADPSVGCNYWNYNWGYAGSMQDILLTMAGISNYGFSSYLSLPQISSEISAGRPFIIRWGWVSGGGHFIVGKGIDQSNNIYYMNPWPGEGSKVATYAWMQSDGNHNWTHTNVLTTNPLTTGIATVSNTEDFSVFPVPAHEVLTISNSQGKNAELSLFDLNGRLLLSQGISSEYKMNTSGFERGVYILKITRNNHSEYRKIVLE